MHSKVMVLVHLSYIAHFILRLISVLGPLSIVHQSPSTVYLPSGSTIPIFCVASKHSLDYVYQWKHGAVSLYSNSPVLWVDRVGPYICNVTHSFHNTQAASQVINIEGLVILRFIYK